MMIGGRKDEDSHEEDGKDEMGKKRREGGGRGNDLNNE